MKKNKFIDNRQTELEQWINIFLFLYYLLCYLFSFILFMCVCMCRSRSIWKINYDRLERVINKAVTIASTISRRYTLPRKSNRELSACHSNYFNAIATSALNAVLTHLKRSYVKYRFVARCQRLGYEPGFNDRKRFMYAGQCRAKLCVNNFQWLHSDVSAESAKPRVHAKINWTILKGRRYSKIST